jgi:predicted phosphodiesterase
VEQFRRRLSLHAGGTSKTVVHGSLDRRVTTLVRQALLIMENGVRIRGHSDEATFRLQYGTLSNPGSRDGYRRRQNRARRN